MAGLNLLHDKRIPTLPEGFHSDGGNLYLRVRGKGRNWVYRFKAPKGVGWADAGKAIELGLGTYPARKLKDVRDVAANLRSEIANKRDPRAFLKPAPAASDGKTFAEYAADYIAGHEAGWRNAKHRQQWRNTIIGPDSYAGPAIGSLRPADITSAHVHKLLAPLWGTKTETATRLRQRIETILDYAFVLEGIDRRNPARWRGNLQHLLPDPRKAAKAAGRGRSHPAPRWQDAPAIMAALREKPTVVSASALRFSVLTAARSTEVRAMVWGEIDLAGRAWHLPGHRAKNGEDHSVPLSIEAVGILQATLDRLAPATPAADDRVFPGPSGGLISDVSVNKSLALAVRDAELGGHFTAHGFARSTFRDWVAEATEYSDKIAEAALNHKNPNETEAAYLRTKFFERQVELMSAWGAFLTPQ